MNHPYREFEETPLWKSIDAAIKTLEQNRDVELRTDRDHFIGYLCQYLAAQKVVAESSLSRK
ncbi:hypothetical protein N425_03275 [Tannerella sp. oral taxon BU063 isolate Cell 2]|uniref:Uncharacterized protein n=1 Tax=Tannerella sp. oral taxon BU063 isolate Cell 2 TaxID=1411148 RepID=W2C671_9BACT|nr:hypothetical protein N425_03275 [Tannerella sp. oral taxon BU063 isolate Cell 2]